MNSTPARSKAARIIASASIDTGRRERSKSTIVESPKPAEEASRRPTVVRRRRDRRSRRCVRDNRRNFVEFPTDLALGDFDIVSVLEIHPELCRGTEHLAETQGGVGGDPSCFRRDAFEARTRQVTSLGERTGGQIEWQKKFFSQNFSGMHGSKFFRHCYHSVVFGVVQSSVVIGDLDISWSLLGPNETHSELIIDPDRVLSLPIPAQRLKPISRRRAQIIQVNRGVEIAQFPAGDFHKISGKTLRALALIDRRCDLILEALNHTCNVSIVDT